MFVASMQSASVSASAILGCATMPSSRPSLILMCDSSSWPTVDTTPEEVVAAQLQALSDYKLTRVFQLFSRARRAILTEEGRSQGGGGQLDPPPIEIQRRVRRALDTTCPGLIGHGSSEIISGLTLNEEGGGRLPRWCGRVKVDTFYSDMYDTCDGGFLAAAAAAEPPRYFLFTLTRQSPAPEAASPKARRTLVPTRRDALDGFEGCWLVWCIEPERRGGGGGGDGPPVDDGDDGPPGRELSLPETQALVTTQ